jgi:hypothetical protein
MGLMALVYMSTKDSANEMSSMAIRYVIETTGLGVFGEKILRMNGRCGGPSMLHLGIKSLGLKLRKFMFCPKS